MHYLIIILRLGFFQITDSSYNHMMKNALDKLNKFFGVVIAVNIFHQIVSSAGYLIDRYTYP